MVLGIFGKGEKVVPVGVYEENCRENIQEEPKAGGAFDVGFRRGFYRW